MKKATKKTLVRVAVGVAAVASAVGIVMLIGKSSNGKTHDASAFTHGLKVIGDAVCGLAGKEGSMYAGATVVAAVPFGAAEVADCVAEACFADDNPIQFVEVPTPGGTPPSGTTAEEEPVVEPVRKRKQIYVPTNNGEVTMAISEHFRIRIDDLLDDEDTETTAA